MEYGMAIRVKAPFETVVAWVTEALREQGFGVLTTIDVKETLHAKVGRDIEPYRILGACNPSLVSWALDLDRQVGLLLPCNVVVRAYNGSVLVEAANAELLAAAAGKPELEPVASDANRRLRAALRVVADIAR